MKKCPWCGKAPMVCQNPLWYGTHGYKNEYEVSVECANSNCPVRPGTRALNTLSGKGQTDLIEQSIEMWNSYGE